MQRRALAPRPDWRARVEGRGMLFHTWDDGGVARPYWAEGACYELAAAEADAIEIAANELHARCLDAVAHVVEHGRYEDLGLDAHAGALVEKSWRAGEPALYGRMDFAFGDGVPKLLEYNADTPTSLLEAAVIQWDWLADCRPDGDQANTLHERLIAAWRALAPRTGDTVHFAFVDDALLEDELTVGYLRDTAEQAGLRTVGLAMEDIGYQAPSADLVDLDGAPIRALFKLYPWEGLLLDALAPALPALRTCWLEPAWKMVLSNKAILPVLWELFPDHPNLLPAARTPLAGGWVRKPLFGREGANVTINAPGIDLTTPGPYADRGFVYQAYADLGSHAGARPVIGAWVIGGAFAGLGIRETDTLVTTDKARFVPHVVVADAGVADAALHELRTTG